MTGTNPISRDREICFSPIGIVQNSFNEPTSEAVMHQAQSCIILDESLLEALDGLEIGQSILILFHFDRSLGDFDLHQHPCGDKTLPKRGVFALRTPHRPNGIGVSQVTLLVVEGNVLTVLGLDALNNTPVLDIKPG